MLQYGNLSLGFPAPQFFKIQDEIALNAFFIEISPTQA
jgi:hypothetical protein